MSDKPTYLGLLNAIAVGETRAHQYLTAWADVTKNPELRRVLLTVAAREGEHGMSFAKRINELGYEVRWRDDPNFDKQMAIARSNKTDMQKAEKLGVGKLGIDGPDIFDGVFNDHSIDIRTGELLGRYISEERDSARLLRCCYEQLRGTAGGAADGEASRLDAIENKIDAVCRAVEELRQIVCAQSMATTS